MTFGKMFVAVAIMTIPATLWAGHPSVRTVGHCASCGVEAPSCGCDDVVHCATCAPQCGCCCRPGLIPGLLNGVDRMLTNLFTCRCRPTCCDVGCVDACGGCGGDGGGHYHHPEAIYPTPASDALDNPFQDDPIPPQARYRQPYRPGAYPRRTSRPSQHAPRTQRPTRYRTAATSPRVPPAPIVSRSGVAPVVPRTVDRVAEAINEPADTKPRILKVEYAKPIVAPKAEKLAEKLAEPKPLAKPSLRISNAQRLSPTPRTNSGSSSVPRNPLR